MNFETSSRFQRPRCAPWRNPIHNAGTNSLTARSAPLLLKYIPPNFYTGSFSAKSYVTRSTNSWQGFNVTRICLVRRTLLPREGTLSARQRIAVELAACTVLISKGRFRKCFELEQNFAHVGVNSCVYPRHLGGFCFVKTPPWSQNWNGLLISMLYPTLGWPGPAMRGRARGVVVALFKSRCGAQISPLPLTKSAPFTLELPWLPWLPRLPRSPRVSFNGLFPALTSFVAPHWLPPLPASRLLPTLFPPLPRFLLRSLCVVP